MAASRTVLFSSIYDFKPTGIDELLSQLRPSVPPESFLSYEADICTFQLQGPSNKVNLFSSRFCERWRGYVEARETEKNMSQPPAMTRMPGTALADLHSLISPPPKSQVKKLQRGVPQVESLLQLEEAATEIPAQAIPRQYLTYWGPTEIRYSSNPTPALLNLLRRLTEAENCTVQLDQDSSRVRIDILGASEDEASFRSEIVCGKLTNLGPLMSILANRAKSTVLLVGDRLWRYRFQYRQLDKLHVARILSDTGYQHFPIYSRMFQIVPRSYDATTDLYQELPHMLYRHGSTTESKGQSSIWLHHDFPSFGFKSEGLHLDCWNGPTQRISLEPETVQEQLHESQYQSRTDFERVKRWAGNVDIFLSSTEAQMSAELSVVPEVRPPPRARARKERKVKALDVGPSPESASNQDKRNVTSANIAVGTRVGEPAHSQHEIVQLVPRSEGKGQNVSVKPSTPDHYGENLPTSTLIDPGSPRDLLTPFVPLPLLMSPQSMLKPTALRHSSMQPYDFGTQNPSTAAIGYEAASIASPSNVVAPSTVGVSESSGALPMNMAAINMQRLEELRAAAPFTEQKINGVASRKRHKAMNQKAMKPTQSTGTTRTKGKTQQQLPLDKTNEVFGVLPPSLHPPQSPLQTKDHGPMIKGDTNFTWSSLKEEQSLSGEVACLLSPVLNAARAFSGELIFEIQLGQVFLKRNLENVEEKNYSFEELSDNFRGRMSNLHVDPPATVFSPMLTSNGNDVDYLRTLTSKDGPMFMEACDDSQVIYEFHCQTSKHEAFILRVDAESQDCSMDSSTDTLVTVNLLHPGHVWDARAVVRATSAISSAGHIGAALLELFNSLYAPAGSKRPTIYFQVRNEDILIQKIHVRRRTRHQCLMEGFEDVILTITEIQDLRISNGLAKVLNNGESVVQYLAAGLSHAEMVDDSKLWYECSLHIKSVRDMLNDNLSQGLGCLAKWTGNDIVQSPSFDKLLDLTTIVINNIDGLGVYNRAPRLPSQLNRSVTSANGIGGTNARSWKPDPILPGASASQCGADEARGVFW